MLESDIQTLVAHTVEWHTM